MQNTNFFEFNEQQTIFKEQIDRFVEKEIRPFARQWDEEAKCPIEIFEKLASIDALAIGFPEEFSVILGPNGAGKSTLLKVLSNDVLPYEGHVSFNGIALSHIDKKTLAKQRAVLPQSSNVTFEV